MRNIRPITAVALACTLIFTTTAFKCGTGTPAEEKQKFINYAKDINAAFITAGPLIVQLKPNLKSIWDKGTDMASRLIVAVEGSDKVVASELLVDLVPIFTTVIDEFTDNTTILVTLSLANIALQFFANHYMDSIAATGGGHGAAAGGARVRAFAARKKWQCRDSVSGQFRKMEYCQANPSTSTVETR